VEEFLKTHGFDAHNDHKKYGTLDLKSTARVLWSGTQLKISCSLCMVSVIFKKEATLAHL
jgi:hypothetical protein